jgi:hypothetical protein
VAGAALAVLAIRAVTGERTLVQAVVEMLVFLGLTALLTWATERTLVRQLLREAGIGHPALHDARVASAG